MKQTYKFNKAYLLNHLLNQINAKNNAKHKKHVKEPKVLTNSSTLSCVLVLHHTVRVYSQYRADGL